MAKIRWKDIADSLIKGNWSHDNPFKPLKDIDDAITKAADQRLILCLMVDIAESLRILRCQNFKEIPSILKQIKTNTHKPKRRKKVNGK